MGASARLQPADGVPSEALVAATAAGLANGVDREWGGFGTAPKFPSTMMLDLLLTEHRHRRRAGQESPEMASAVTVTPRRDGRRAGCTTTSAAASPATRSTASGCVPHFEKMLYDQALLLRVYSHAAVALGIDRVATGGRRDVEYVLRDLRHARRRVLPPPRTPTRPAPTATATRVCSTRGRPTRCAPCSAPTRDAAMEWYGITDGGNFEVAVDPEPDRPP